MTTQAAIRISKQSLSSLKAKADVKPDAVALLKRMAQATISESADFFHQLRQISNYRDHSCNDGHLLPAKLVAGAPVKCISCNTEITSLYQIRSQAINDATKRDDKNREDIAPIEFLINKTLKQRRLDLIPVR